MSEVWLQTNRRALAVGLVLPGALTAVAAGGLFWTVATHQHWAVGAVLAVLTAAPLWMIGELLFAMRQPRLAFATGELLIYLEPTRPTRVPIGIVECFFLGQGPSELPKLRGREPETQNVIIRLSESATEWKHRDVRPAIGHWCEGYITIRGSWCEPITPGLMRRLNQRLAEVQRNQRALAAAETSS